MPALENASLFVELGTKRNADMQSEMFETMRSFKEDIESLKEDNIKLMNAKSDQEEINELILKSLTKPQNNNGKKSCSSRKKRKGATQDDSSEETKENILVILQDLRKYKEIKVGK